MKAKLLFILFLTPLFIFSQTQIGADIYGKAEDDTLGTRVSLSSDGSIVAIGAPFYDGTDYKGAVRIYENRLGIWTQIGDDIIGEAIEDYSGTSVSLSSDGSIVAIGAPYNNANEYERGHVRVYKNIGGVWTQTGEDIDGEYDSDESGTTVSLSSDGSVVAIGAPFNDENGTHSGHVRVYKNIDGIWNQIGDDIDGDSSFSATGDSDSVSLSSDGSIIAIGAPKKNLVRVFKNIDGVWTQIGNVIDGNVIGGNFGYSVSLSSDGNIVGIGAPFSTGVTQVLENIGGIWTQIGTDIIGDPGYASGTNISLSSVGSIIAIGAPNKNNGQVKTYENINGNWTLVGVKIEGENDGDRFGHCVSISSDGSKLAIGAPWNDVNGSSSGQVRVYDLSEVLGLEDNEISKNFTLYPNPVKEKLEIQLNTTLEFRKATVYNNYGQKLLESDTIYINVTSLSTGVYLVLIETNKGKGVKKLIIE